MIFVLLCALGEDARNLVEKIFKDNYSKFYKVAYSYLQSDEGAKDAISDAMIKIIKNIDKISSMECPQMTAFCVTIVRNTSLDAIRKNKRIVLVDDAELELKLGGAETTENPNHAFQDLLNSVKVLSDEERRLIYLRYGLELGYKEIANVLNISEETAKKRGQRILSKLKDVLGKERII